jgi:hypothetical protein
MKLPQQKITKPQTRFLTILFQDLGYSREQRIAKLGTDYAVYSIDELSKVDASKLIDELLEAKLKK